MKKHSAALALALFSAPALATLTVDMHLVSERGVGDKIGEVAIKETQHGLVFTPALKGLRPGLHGFHLHENPSCAAREKDGKMTPAQAAGDHYDPKNSERHGAPWGAGHLGDLPALSVSRDGSARHPVLAPRLKLDQLAGRSLVVHEGGDNYSDHPAPLGGGGTRVACGVIR
jgi:Cu-Zn family superoxide dismutase